MKNCKQCNAKLVKNGKDIKGNQRYLCKHCGNTSYDENHRSRLLTKEQQKQIVELSNQSIRSIALAVGCSHTTVLRYLKTSK